MNLDADMASTLIVLAILLGGALAALLAGRKSPAEILTDPHRWH